MRALFCAIKMMYDPVETNLLSLGAHLGKKMKKRLFALVNLLA